MKDTSALYIFETPHRYMCHTQIYLPPKTSIGPYLKAMKNQGFETKNWTD